MKQPLTIQRQRAAALVIDMQEEHRQDSRYLVEGFEDVLANIQRLQQAARQNGIVLIHCAYIVDLDAATPRRFHPLSADGSSAFSDKNDPLTAICAEVAPADGETVLVKAEASAFGDDRLETMLRARDIEWLFICGVWSEACVDATVKAAVARGFRVVLVKDACGSGTAAMHQTAVLNLANRLYGGAVTDTTGACRLMTGEAVEVWTVEGAVPLRFDFNTIEALYTAL